MNKLSKYILDGVAAFQCKTTATPTEKPLHVQELVIHLALQLSKRRTVPCHAIHPAWPPALPWMAQVPWLQDNLSRLPATENPAGSASRYLPGLAFL